MTEQTPQETQQWVVVFDGARDAKSCRVRVLFAGQDLRFSGEWRLPAVETFLHQHPNGIVMDGVIPSSDLPRNAMELLRESSRAGVVRVYDVSESEIKSLFPIMI